MGTISILLVDDHKMLRQGLRALLLTQPGLEIVGEAQDGRAAVAMAAELQPNLVIMDLGMPQMDGVEATRRILRAAPHTKVVVLSSFNSDQLVRELTEAGVAGYFLKQTPAPEFIQALRDAHEGKSRYDPAIARRIVNLYGPTVRLSAHQLKRMTAVALTAREREVVGLVAEGMSNRQAADELGISEKTVRRHRQQAMAKLDIHETAGLTRYAIEAGFVRRPPAAQAAEAIPGASQPSFATGRTASSAASFDRSEVAGA